MVSAKEQTDLSDILKDLNRPNPIAVKAPPECYQDGKTFRKSSFDCLDCNFFDSCKV